MKYASVTQHAVTERFHYCDSSPTKYINLLKNASSWMLRRVILVRTEFQRKLAPPSSG
jgi:hypothetical protein